MQCRHSRHYGFKTWLVRKTASRFLSRFLQMLAATGVILVTAASVCAEEDPPPLNPLESVSPVTDAMLANPASNDWLAYRGNYGLWGYSPLTQIDTRNVSKMTLAWVSSMQPGTNESSPLVHDGVLFLPHPGDTIEALDAKSGERLWIYQRQLPVDLHLPNAQGGTLSLILSPVKRNIAIFRDRIYTVTGDAAVLALDMRSGQVVWETRVGDYREMVSTSGPIVADGKVITGRSCDASFAGGCFITAHDADTGKELWRRYVIPRPGEPGDETWKGLPLEERRHVGAWGVASFDPSLGLLYMGTSVPAPSVEVIRGTAGGDALYSNSTLALDVKTGKIVWYHQHLPRDNWDMDHPLNRILVDSSLRPDSKQLMSLNPAVRPGETRKVVTGTPGKTGIIWTLDRQTGEFLWARETVRQNYIEAIDPHSGRATVNSDLILRSASDKYPESCPSTFGGANYPPAAYSPQTRALYMPLFSSCQDIKVKTPHPTPADLYGLDFVARPADTAATTGWLQAVSVETGKTLWTHKQPGRLFGALATAGKLVFVGDSAGRFMAFDSSTGKILWATQLHGAVGGAPIAFSVDGVEYVAVTAGANLLADFADRLSGLRARGSENLLYVFRLPPRIPSPMPLLWRTNSGTGSSILVLQQLSTDIEAGKTSYEGSCSSCHGGEMKGTGHAPSLTGCAFTSRWTGQSIGDFFNRIKTTMPVGAAGSLDQQTVANIVAYWLKRHHGPSELTDSAGAWSGTTIDTLKSACTE
jgi:PQQ-dependent dehydrogenase (methanol/ethanol family)